VNTVPAQEPDAASVRAILRSRAEELARPPETRAQGARLLEILEFTLGQERYAFPSSRVRGVFRLTEITPLPGLPPFVLGVINVRGRILSVMDIRRLLEFGDTGLTNLNQAIILQGGDMELAVLADEVTGVYTVDADEGQRTLPTLSARQREYLRGVTENRVVILDADKLLASRDLLVGAGS
jgi:purine-binding chemotaxis protein CheW